MPACLNAKEKEGSPIMEGKERLLVEVSKMYYYYGYSQKKIAEIINLSRAYVCQLLDAARREGIVEIKVREYSMDDGHMEYWLKEKYGLKNVKVFKNQNFLDKDKMIKAMAETVSQLFGELVSDGATIAFTWGNTLYRISKEIEVEREYKNIRVIPLSGGMGNIEKNIYVSEISTNFAQAFNGTPYVIPLPVLVENNKIKESIYSDSVVAGLLNMWEKVDIAVFTVGDLGEDNAMFRNGFIDKNDLKKLRKNGLAGDFCTHFLDKEGEVCDMAYDDRTISISLQDLKKIPNKICVVYDVSKAMILRSVLKKGYIDHLFVDEATVHLMKLTEEN
jgi:deoxyribonucleoside regulator